MRNMSVILQLHIVGVLKSLYLSVIYPSNELKHPITNNQFEAIIEVSKTQNTTNNPKPNNYCKKAIAI